MLGKHPRSTVSVVRTAKNEAAGDCLGQKEPTLGKHSVWISTTHFWGEPQTPEATQMLQFSQICAPSIDRLVNSVLS